MSYSRHDLCEDDDTMDIEVRRTVPEDWDPLTRMIMVEWKFDLYSKGNGLNMSRHYLLHILNGSTHALTVLVDGVPSGAVVLYVRSGERTDLSAEEDAARRAYADDPNIGLYDRDFGNITGAYAELCKDLIRPEWAELRLLIVSEDCKGMGLGKMLLRKAAEILREYKLDGLFFYTDTDCNFGFYDHLGAKRAGYKDVPCMDETLRVFGYSLDTRNIS